jgi:hypothetical protein
MNNETGEITMERAELATLAKTFGIKGWNKMKTADLAKAVNLAQNPRKGRNPSGNTPWRPKLYFVPENITEATDFAKLPNQVQLMLKSAVNHGFVDADNSANGTAIASAAIKDGMRTKIDPAALFAYYRKRMETVGLVFAGYATKQ